MSTPLVGQRSAELRHMAFKFGQFSSLLEYMRGTLTAMHEAWEDVLVMMDTKLASYAKASEHVWLNIVLYTYIVAY